ncbi:MAG: pilus assembly protein PilM [Opitutales bacterium]
MASTSKLIINCGTTYVTAGYFSVNAGRLLLENFYAQELDYDYSNQDEWFLALSVALKKMNVKGRAVIIAPSSIILPKTIQVPHVTGDRQREVIAFEAEKNIPYSLDEVTWDYQVISDDGIETEVLLVSMKKSVANELCQAISSVGLIPETLEASSILDYNTWKFCGLPEDSIMLNVGAKSTNLIIAKEDALFVRTLAMGGNTLTQGIADSLGKTFLQAEAIKTAFFANENNLNSSDPAVDIFKTNEKSMLKRVSMEIKRSILSYKRKVKSPIAKIYLSGRSSVLPNFSTTICEDQGVDVEYINPLESLAISPKVDSNLLAYNSTVLTELVGEAARMLLPSSVGVNLLPPEITKQLAFEAKRPTLIFSALVLAASMAMPFVYLSDAIDATKAQTKALKADIPAMQSRIDAVANNKAQIDALASKISNLEGLANTKSNWMQFFVELEKCLFDVKDVWLESLTVVRKEAKIDAETQAVTTPAEYTLKVVGRMLLRDADSETGYDSAVAMNRVTALLTNFKKSSFVDNYTNIKTDPSNPKILKFTFDLLVNKEKPI